MTVGVVIPCHRQERFLPRTVGALERALAGREWRGVLVLTGPGGEPLPALSEHWQVIVPPEASRRLLTPGAARMVGFAACGGDGVLFVDADVEVDAAWVEAALATAAREPLLGGLWGRLEEWFEDGAGERPGSPDMYQVGDDDRRTAFMTTPAWYRRAALLEVGGYDPRLSSEEDFELGLRFARRGLELRSLGLRAGRHWSAPRPSFAELGRRWSSGLCFGQGQVLRLYLGRPGFGALLRRQSLYLVTLAMWGLGLAALAAALIAGQWRALGGWMLLVLGVIAVMSARKRSVRLGVLSLLTWTLNGLGLLVGLARGGAGAPLPAVGGARC
jgi:glycosyltransferase involved in cell wall biosynthesis